MSDKVDLTKRQWDPDDPELSSDICAYEGSAIRRLVWSRWPTNDIAELMKMTPTDIRKTLMEDNSDWAKAVMNRRPIYAGRVAPGYDPGDKLKGA